MFVVYMYKLYEVVLCVWHAIKYKIDLEEGSL